MTSTVDAEQKRLREARELGIPWKKWGPYLSERQWGTVREDYSKDGNAWDYFTHDHSRSRAYRWGEDGIAGLSDDKQRLCFALALWNGRDPILKERLFGLTNSEGNHGEDVKEYYFYLDSTPTHSYMKYLYKYPQAAFPYEALVAESRRRDRTVPEFELVDTGVFDGGRYFDGEIEYAKATTEDILIGIHVSNRGPEAAALDLLPTIWFRNRWTWNGDTERPELTRAGAGRAAFALDEPRYGRRWLHCQGEPALLFTENETNQVRIFGEPNENPFTKDAFHRFLVDGETAAVNPAERGTKGAALYRLDVPAGATVRISCASATRQPDSPSPRSTTRSDEIAAERRRGRRVLRQRDPGDALGRRRASRASRSRASLVETVLPLHRPRLAGRRRRSRRAARAPAAAATISGPTSTTRRHLDADKWEHLVRPGISRSTWSRSRSSTRNSPRSSSSCSCASAMHTTGSSPAYSGRSTT